MAKKEIPELRFTKTEADYLKKVAGIKLMKHVITKKTKEAKKILSTLDFNKIKKDSTHDWVFIELAHLSMLKMDKGRKLLQKNPNFIFGKTGDKHVEMVFELRLNLMLSLTLKKTRKKLKEKIIEKLDVRLENMPALTSPSTVRNYYNKI